jgi:hypothetical protein
MNSYRAIGHLLFCSKVEHTKVFKCWWKLWWNNTFVILAKNLFISRWNFIIQNDFNIFNLVTSNMDMSLLPTAFLSEWFGVSVGECRPCGDGFPGCFGSSTIKTVRILVFIMSLTLIHVIVVTWRVCVTFCASCWHVRHSEEQHLS